MRDDYLDRHDLIQRLSPKTYQQVEDEEQAEYLEQWAKDHPEGDKWFRYGAVFLIGIVWGMVTLSLVKSCDKEPQLAFTSCSTAECHSRKMSMERYFEKSGNPHPKQMAEAVLATKRPKLLAAMAVKGEKNTPYTVRRGGYKKRHSGSWQVNPKDWGKVPYDAVGQALQSERILDELLDKKPLRQALNSYGGDSTDAYSRRVLAELQRVP